MDNIAGFLIKTGLGLLALIAVAIYAVNASNDSKASTAIADMQTFSSQVQAFYGTAPTFATLTNTVAVNSKLATADMITGASTLVNQWQGAVTITPDATNTMFDIAHAASIPNDACAKMASAFLNLQKLVINSTTVATLPIDPGTASADCNAGTNSMTFTFSH